jgi:hypothetical protein
MANKIKLAGTSSNSFSIGLSGATISSTSVSSPYTLTLPANTGMNTQVLTTDGTGNLSWTSSGGGGGSPGGANTQLQFNNNGTFGGISTVTYNGTNLSLGSVSNINISGGTANYVLQTNGSGTLSWVAQSGGGGSTVTDFTPSFLLGGM